MFTHLFDGNKSLRELVGGFGREEALRGLRKKGKEEERNKRHKEDFGGEHSITPTAEVTRRDGQMFHRDCSASTFHSQGGRELLLPDRPDAACCL